MQSYSSYNEQSMNFSNINGVKDIKEYNMNYHKKNDNLGLGELNIRNNNKKEKILFNENNMMDVAAYLKNKRNKRNKRNKTLKEKLQDILYNTKYKSLKNLKKKIEVQMSHLWGRL